jgi:hypothetical protein
LRSCTENHTIKSANDVKNLWAFGSTLSNCSFKSNPTSSFRWSCINNTMLQKLGRSIDKTAVWSQPISGIIVIKHLVAFYDIHGRKREVAFFYFVPNTTRDLLNIHRKISNKNTRRERRALLLNLRMHASLSCVVLSKHHENSVQVFSAFTGFLWSPIKKNMDGICMNVTYWNIA